MQDVAGGHLMFARLDLEKVHFVWKSSGKTGYCENSDMQTYTDLNSENSAAEAVENLELGGSWECVLSSPTYNAYAKELECLWRWIIVLNGSVVQEGCSISLDSARRAVNHVMAFYAVQSRSAGYRLDRPGAEADESGASEDD